MSSLWGVLNYKKYYIIGDDLMKKVILLCLSLLLLSTTTTNANDVEFAFEKHHQNLELIQLTILDKDDLSASEVFDYISAVTKLTEKGIEDLQDMNVNTESKELQLKKFSINIVEMLLLKEREK